MRRENRNRKVTVRFSSKEFDELYAHYNQSDCKEMSEYVRSMLLKRKATMRYRNQSLDDLIEELKLLRRELNAVGNNFNQTVKKLNASHQTMEIIQYASLAFIRQKALLKNVEMIKEKICSISDIWLRKL
jgi:hypothetical protein